MIYLKKCDEIAVVNDHFFRLGREIKYGIYKTICLEMMYKMTYNLQKKNVEVNVCDLTVRNQLKERDIHSKKSSTNRQKKLIEEKVSAIFLFGF